MPLDTLLGHETPEGIDLVLDLAGPMVRGLAWAIDFAIRAVLYLVLSMLLGWLGMIGAGVIIITLFLIEWFYPVLFEALRGATPGKTVMGLQVLQDDGAPVGWTSALIRNLLRAADFLPLCNVCGLVTVMVHPRFQRLGDMAAGTVVVYRQRAERVIKVPEAPSQPPRIPLRLEEQRLLLDFCERAAVLSPARRGELAALLPALVGGRQPEAQLLAHANWFLRGKGV